MIDQRISKKEVIYDRRVESRKGGFDE